MSLRALLSGCGVLFVLAFSSLPALADPITVTFWVFPEDGDPHVSGRSTGSFTFERGLIDIPAGGGFVENDTGLQAITDFDFTWGPTHWTTANAGVNVLAFSPTGELIGFEFGGVRDTIRQLSGNTADDILGFDFARVPHSGAVFFYSFAKDSKNFRFSIPLFSSLNPTPEPSSVVLALTGAAILGRRWRRHASGAKNT